MILFTKRAGAVMAAMPRQPATPIEPAFGVSRLSMIAARPRGRHPRPLPHACFRGHAIAYRYARAKITCPASRRRCLKMMPPIEACADISLLAGCWPAVAEISGTLIGLFLRDMTASTALNTGFLGDGQKLRLRQGHRR